MPEVEVEYSKEEIFASLVIRMYLLLDWCGREPLPSTYPYNEFLRRFNSLGKNIKQQELQGSIYSSDVCKIKYPKFIICQCGKVLGRGAAAFVLSCDSCCGQSTTVQGCFKLLYSREVDGNFNCIAPAWWNFARVTALNLYLHRGYLENSNV